MAGSPPGPSPAEVCEGQAHCEFASGQLVRLQRPVTLYWLRQKVCVRVLALKEQNRWLMMVQTTSSDCIAEQRCGGAGLALQVLRVCLCYLCSGRVDADKELSL